MSKKGGSEPSFGDPYDLLGVDAGASDADISKAYRKLALKLHPDKQQGKSPEEVDRVNNLFHDVKEARAFLLEPEHAEDRRKYDLKTASERLRRAEDAKREARMSEQRKAMRDKLAKKEAILKRKNGQSSFVETDKKLLERLKREGIAKREQHAQRAASEAAHQKVKDRRGRAVRLEERQVRLKWSRRRMKTSPSEHSIATILSKFGKVEHVEFIGAKGNEALVTFVDRSSCSPCVEFYEESDEMRAKFVGSRKQKEEELRQSTQRSPSPPRTSRNRDNENLRDRKLRQAEERERLLRQMEMDDQGGGKDSRYDTSQSDTKAYNPERTIPSRSRESKFPPEFPTESEYQGLSPLEKLEKFENVVLGDLVSPDVLRRSQVST